MIRQLFRDLRLVLATKEIQANEKLLEQHPKLKARLKKRRRFGAIRVPITHDFKITPDGNVYSDSGDGWRLVEDEAVIASVYARYERMAIDAEEAKRPLSRGRAGS